MSDTDAEHTGSDSLLLINLQTEQETLFLPPKADGRLLVPLMSDIGKLFCVAARRKACILALIEYSPFFIFSNACTTGLESVRTEV